MPQLTVDFETLPFVPDRSTSYFLCKNLVNRVQSCHVARFERLADKRFAYHFFYFATLLLCLLHFML